ncbi:MAG: hypothetical protein JNM99_19835 [Verrucomicrobiaceae bacterium]|nr:hypothetical protein [Verrucomicrobiaceae bacterium]
MNTIRLFVFAAVSALSCSALQAAPIEVTGPTGSGKFGEKIFALTTGNILVVDTGFDDGATANVGAVHLYRADGTLISTLKGSTANDQVGNGIIKELPNGNVVIVSPNWDNGAIVNAGAVTLINGTTGLSGTVSASNSVVGGAPNDLTNVFIFAVGGAASNYVIDAIAWDNGAATDVGALCFRSGTTPVVGLITPSNALVGSTTNDKIVVLTVLPNGNYVAGSTTWDNGAVVDAGAVIFGNGLTGVSGVVSSSNAQVGSAANDGAGLSIVPLSNGNYVIRRVLWNNGATADVGAVTWCNGVSGGPVGAITSANSFIGSTAGDQIGSTFVALTNGNYVVGSSSFDNGAVANAGAVAWGNGTTGLTGVAGAGNSLLGNSANDSIGATLVALTNGNYVVGSSGWFNASALSVGAATWCSGTGPTTGFVTAANSLVGTTSGDGIGAAITALTNGNYVVSSSQWDNGAIVNAGAVMLCNGSTGTVGVVTPANALVGTSTNEGLTLVTALPNGNYVVLSDSWDNGSVPDVGAATWCSGTTARPVGGITPANSLVGSATGDLSGAAITTLPNGNYVVRASNWDGPGGVNAGAVCWCNGSTGRVGAISKSNALIGSHASDFVSGFPTIAVLTNGNYIVFGRQWDNGSVVDAGFAAWASGTRGSTGEVSAANALVGSTANDAVGFDNIIPLKNGNYIVRSGDWNNGTATKAGALTFGNGTTGTVGVVSPSNSIVGSAALDNLGFGGTNLATDDGFALFRSTTWDNGALANASVAMLLPGTAPFPTGPITISNAVLGGVATPSTALAAGYDAPSRLFVVGKGAENKIVINTFSAGKVGFDQPLVTVTEGEDAKLTVKRTGGTEGTVTVNISSVTAGSTATAGTDFTAVNQLLTFGPGIASQTVSLTTLVNAPTNEPNELIKVTLSGGTAALGTPSTMFVRILDADDTTLPGAPVITAPAPNARVGVDPGDTLTITGTATDNRGISLVEVRLNGGTFTPATLTNNTGTSAQWSIKLQPQTGANLIEVRSSDTKPGTANVSTIVSRSFVVTRPLEVKSTGANGTFTTGFAPRSFRESGKLLTLTATAPSGFLFNKWIIDGGANATASEIGLSAAQLELPTISFVFRESLTLTAEFAPNPFINPLSNPFIRANLTGIYNGIIRPDPALPDRAPLGSNSGEDGSAMSNSTNGFITVNALSNATFTTKLSIDGLVLAFAGSFDGSGTARFGATRDRVVFVNRTGKPPLKVQMIMNTGLGTIGGSITDTDSVAIILADRVHYSASTLVPITLLGPANANQVYNLAFFKFGSPQPSGITNEGFPQGFGPGTLTLTKTGTVTLAATLPDGTSLTASTALNSINLFHLFASLYGNKGGIAGDFLFDLGETNTDVAAGQLDWVRPPLDDQHYPVGWPQGVVFQAVGTKLTITPGASILPGLPTLDADGNADLSFGDGLLPGEVLKKIGITATEVIQKPLPVDNSFTLAITHTTGRFSGNFTHPLGITPYQGIILQKGANSKGFGFFKTKAPAVKDYLGQSGNVILAPQ